MSFLNGDMLSGEGFVELQTRFFKAVFASQYTALISIWGI